MQPDRIIPNPGNPQAWNRYSYVGNRPVNYYDPSGHYPTNCGPDSIYCGGLPENDYYHRPASLSNNSNGDVDIEDDGDQGTEGGGEEDDNVLDCPANHPNCGFSFETCGQGGMVNCPAEPFTFDTSGLPETITLHPLSSNGVFQNPIYDYSTIPPRVIGYRITSYAFGDNIQINWQAFARSLLPSWDDPGIYYEGYKSFAEKTDEIYRFFIKPFSNDVPLALCKKVCGIGITIITTALDLNNATTIDANLQTHDVYFTEPPFSSPLLVAPFYHQR